MTALTAVVSWMATQAVSQLHGNLASKQPLALSIETNPSRISGFDDLPILAVIPDGVQTTGSPGQGCEGFRPWVRSHGGVDAGSTKLQLIVQGKVADPVLISAMRVKILERLPRVTGVHVECPPAAEAQIRAVAIDLDAIPPHVTYQSGSDRPFGFTVQEGETETFNMVASARRAHYRWLLELDLVVSGKKRTIQVSDGGRPFETTSTTGRAWWEWNYRDAWSLSTPGRELSTRTVPAGAPLPSVS
jgi:hypothetical protein